MINVQSNYPCSFNSEDRNLDALRQLETFVPAEQQQQGSLSDIIQTATSIISRTAAFITRKSS